MLHLDPAVRADLRLRLLLEEPNRAPPVLLCGGAVQVTRATNVYGEAGVRLAILRPDGFLSRHLTPAQAREVAAALLASLEEGS